MYQFRFAYPWGRTAVPRLFSDCSLGHQNIIVWISTRRTVAPRTTLALTMLPGFCVRCCCKLVALLSRFLQFGADTCPRDCAGPPTEILIFHCSPTCRYCTDGGRIFRRALSPLPTALPFFPFVGRTSPCLSPVPLFAVCRRHVFRLSDDNDGESNDEHLQIAAWGARGGFGQHHEGAPGVSSTLLVFLVRFWRFLLLCRVLLCPESILSWGSCFCFRLLLSGVQLLK